MSSADTSTTRRRFLLTVGWALGFGAAGCTFETREVAEGSPDRDGGQAVFGVDGVSGMRPVVVPFGDAVRIATPPRTRPVAYVSMVTREVFVDREYRDQASWLLGAHISVSTWVWRIPLPGDSPLTPISPGDERREFEELPIGSWDPNRPPSDGDIRIVLGLVASVTLPLDCVPIQGTAHRVSAEVPAVDVVIPGPGEPFREDFGVLGSGARHADPECAPSSSDLPSVALFGWSHPG